MNPPGNTKAAPARERLSKKVTTTGTNNANSTVAEASDSRHVSIQAALDRVPAAFASVYAPCKGRLRWLTVYVCPHCHLGHAGYAREFEKIPGVRRSRCGRHVWLIVARAYKGEVRP